MNLGWMDEICPDVDDNPRLAKPFNCTVAIRAGASPPTAI
jgi:hypothetical protein